MGLEDARLEHGRSCLTKGNADEFGSDKSRYSGEKEEEEAAANEDEDGVMEQGVLKCCRSTKTNESTKTEKTAKQQRGGGHLTGNNVLKSMEVKVWRHTIKGLKVAKRSSGRLQQAL